MPQNISSRARKVLHLVLFRLVPVLLILVCVWLLIRVAGAFADRVSAGAAYEALRPAFEATATAVAAPDSAQGRAPDALRVLWKRERDLPQQDNLLIQMMTNTPTPDSPPTTLPALPTVGTPRPLPTIYLFQDGRTGESNGTAIPTSVPTLDRFGNDLINILLLGHDGELSDDGFIRTDTMIIVSINRTTGTVAMLSLPRDLFVYIPGWAMQRINLAYIYGERGAFPDGGFGLMRQTLFYNFGLNVHYYAMVNLSGFRGIIDGLGGVEVMVDCAIEDLPLIGAEVPRGAYRVNDDGYYVLPVGVYTMNGGEALWYARSRHNSTDFDRGRRQQQLLRAVWRKARDTGLLANIVPLWSQAMEFVETNLTFEDVLGLVPLALSIDSTQIQQYRLVRTYHTTPWQPPDGSYVQIPNPETMRQLLQDFYTPPTANQLVARSAVIEVYNASGQPGLDRVAADRLASEGFNARPMGVPPDVTTADETVLIDYTGRTKGSSLNVITRALNVRADGIYVQPIAERTADFVVILGRNYNSCSEQGILPASG
jgi:LCP family protein required for cell wall assembly